MTTASKLGEYRRAWDSSHKTAQRMEGTQRGKPPPVPPRPREPMTNGNINIDINPSNHRPAHQQQQQQKKTTYATVLQTVEGSNGG
jgi:hypothetical protein